MSTVYLISGSNRGIGLGLVKALAAVSGNIIFAGARDENAPSLLGLAAEYPDQVFPVRLISGDTENNKAVAEIIEKQFGRLDVVIANAGIGRFPGPVETTPLDDFTEHFQVNVIGTLALFQSTAYLLRQSSVIGKFVVVSSSAGSIGKMNPLPSGPYGTSKAAVNHLTIKIQAETPDLIVFPICPGPVATELSQQAATHLGWDDQLFANHTVSVETAVGLILKHVSDAAQVEGAQDYWSADGQVYPW